MELTNPIIIEVPGRWTLQHRDASSVSRELSTLAETLIRGCEALHGCYMRICDLVRLHELTDKEVKEALGKHFPQPRISEILRVSRAPEDVYRRYRSGFFGFKAALEQCRGYRVTPNAELNRRRIRRTAERLVLLLDGPGELKIRGRLISVS